MPISIEDPEFFCFNKLSNKVATLICGGFILCLSIIILLFKNSVVNIVVLGIIMFLASIMLIFGVRKKLTWMFLPFLWLMSASVWLNPTSFIICIIYYYTFRNSWMYEFHPPERRDKYITAILSVAVANIFGTFLSVWIYVIVQKCHNLISFESTVIPFGANRKHKLEDYIFDEPKYEFCFGRFHVKNGTYFVSGFTILAWCIGILISAFIEPWEIFWKLFIVLAIVIFVTIGPIIGIRKNISWLLLPFLWYLGSLVFFNIYELLMLTSFASFRDKTYANNITLERKFESMHYKLPLNIFLTFLSTWFFSICHKCYVLMEELKHAKTNPNLNIQLDALQKC